MDQIVEITKAEQRALKRVLAGHGNIIKMERESELSRRAIINARDLGRVRESTLQKIREYLAQQKAAS